MVGQESRDVLQWQRQPFIVLDQNVLRKAEDLARICKRCELRQLSMLLPDGAFHEFCKSGHALATITNSLRLLAPYRGIVRVSWKLWDVVLDETASEAPSASIENPRTTELLRLILSDIERGSDVEVRRLLDGPHWHLMNDSQEVWSAHERHRQLISDLCDAIRRDLSPDDLKILRQSGLDAPAKWLSSSAGAKFVYQGLKVRGVSNPCMLCFWPSVTAGFISAVAGLAIYWLAIGGFDSVPAKVSTNDFQDVEGIVFGALGDSLATSDKRARIVSEAVAEGFAARLVLGRQFEAPDSGSG